MLISQKAIFKALLVAILTGSLLFTDTTPAMPQIQGSLTYPEIITALLSRMPTQTFRNRTELITWLIPQIRKRKVDKPLTPDREDDLRQAGATEALIQAIRANSPAVPAPSPTPVEPVDLGELAGRAVNLIKPEYTLEARQAKTTGSVKLALDLDETGRVTSVSRLTVLENGLTEQSIEAAKRTMFRPALRDGKPVLGRGTITYRFNINLFDVAGALASANSLRNSGECDKAIPEYNRVLEVNGKHAKALLGRGTCHLIDANYNLAVSDLAIAVEADKQDSDLWFFYALALDFKGDTDAAADAYEKALRIRPELDTQAVFKCLYIDRASLTAEQARGRANEIINACAQALRGNSSELTPMLYYKRGIGYRLKLDFDKAISDLEGVRRTTPEFTAVNTQLQLALNGRGLEAFNRKDFKKAFDDVSAAIVAEPKSPTPYINRCAIHLYAWKRYNEAITDCSTAIKLATRSSSAYSHRGYAYEMLNNRSEAIADYKRALELDPQNQAARSNLNRIQAPSIKY